MQAISEQQRHTGFALFSLGFRPFFLAAALWAVVATLLWLSIYLLGWHVQTGKLSAVSWHAHEMIFGYSLAVVAGFLLTAARNWTGIDTLHGFSLAGLFLLWLLARVSPFLAGQSAAGQIIGGLSAVLDNLFILWLMLSVALPIVKARLWHNLPIVLLLCLLLISNLLFYAGVFGWFPAGLKQGLYAGLYLVVLLIFIMAGRVLPFFIEKGVDIPLRLARRPWLDITSLLLFCLYGLVDVFTQNERLAAVLAGVLLLMHAARMAFWYTHAIWRKPLLWVLYLAYAFLSLAFLLRLGSYLLGTSAYLAVHAFAFGGIGLMTLGMMSRISLGHTGRNVMQPPVALFWIFLLLLLGAVFRVLIPLLDQAHYTLWISLAMLCWILAFAAFFITYLPILLRPDVESRPL